jgi:hypothetical protein
MKFTPGTGYRAGIEAHIPTINHTPAPFTQNKLYAANPRDLTTW